MPDTNLNNQLAEEVKKETLNYFAETAFQPVSDDCMSTVHDNEAKETKVMGEIYRKLKEIDPEISEEAWLGRGASRKLQAERTANKIAKHLQRLFEWWFRTYDKLFTRVKNHEKKNENSRS